jgi:hypothetical protein
MAQLLPAHPVVLATDAPAKTSLASCPAGTESATTYDSARERELFHRLNNYREANNLPPPGLER